MAAQQAQFAETIRAMKLALKRRADDSDSDTSIHAATNRNHKLQKRAKYVRSGQLDTTGGTRAYRKKIEHASYTRHIISTNPPLYDFDGDVVSRGEESREASPIAEDPFGEVQLERLLRPLTAASELENHPSFSVAFKSKALTEMVGEAAEMLRRQRAALWKAKMLLQRFKGDVNWAPCGEFETEQDGLMLLAGDGDEQEGGAEPSSAVPSLLVGQDALELELAKEQEAGEILGNDGGEAHTDVMDGVETADMAVHAIMKAQLQAQSEMNGLNGGSEQPAADGEDGIQEIAAENTTSDKVVPPETNIEAVDSIEGQESAESPRSNSERDPNGTNPPQHSMTTRARARSPVHSDAGSPTPSDSASIPPIHPWFLAPQSAMPDRDLGLPAQEAEESRRLLLLYVQKQEQIVRSLSTLFDGLQRADRLRREVRRAAKAEGHVKDDGRGNMVTEMSDGEDWYDPSDWGLEGRDLKMQKNGRLGLEKGKDEVDEIVEEDGRRGPRRRRVHRM